MFANSDKLFELKDNEIIFEEICHKLKTHPFQSPWTLCFDDENGGKNIDCEVQEFHFSEINLLQIPEEHDFLINSLTQNPLQASKIGQTFDEKKFQKLKTCLISVEDDHQVEYLEDIHLLNSLTLSQIPKFCEFLSNAFSNEAAIALFLSAILNLEKPLSITVAGALISHIVFPKILSFKSSNCRNLSLSILNFFRIYPKAVIDEILVPSLKQSSLEAPLQEILFKLIKCNISNEHVAYSIKSILDVALPSDNTFLLMHNLIEKKIPYESNLHSAIAFTLSNWSTTSSSNMKFTKLLISILSTYGSELLEQQIKMYSDALKVNKTIMKKAAESVIKKLKML